MQGQGLECPELERELNEMRELVKENVKTDNELSNDVSKIFNLADDAGITLFAEL